MNPSLDGPKMFLPLASSSRSQTTISETWVLFALICLYVFNFYSNIYNVSSSKWIYILVLVWIEYMLVFLCIFVFALHTIYAHCLFITHWIYSHCLFITHYFFLLMAWWHCIPSYRRISRVVLDVILNCLILNKVSSFCQPKQINYSQDQPEIVFCFRFCQFLQLNSFTPI